MAILHGDMKHLELMTWTLIIDLTGEDGKERSERLMIKFYEEVGDASTYPLLALMHIVLCPIYCLCYNQAKTVFSRVC